MARGGIVGRGGGGIGPSGSGISTEPGPAHQGAGAGSADLPRAGVIGARTRALRGGRPLLGGLLVAGSAVLVFATTIGGVGGHRRAYVVAADGLPAGTVIGPGELTTVRMELPSRASSLAFSSPSQLIGRSLEVPLAAGEMVEASMLAPQSGRSTLRPVSIPVDPASLVDLSEGASVDVLATTGAGDAGAGQTGQPSTTVVMRGAVLRSVSKPGSGLIPSSSGSTTVVTLGVSTLSEARMLVSAAHRGSVELVQAEPGDGSGPGPREAG